MHFLCHQAYSIVVVKTSGNLNLHSPFFDDDYTTIHFVFAEKYGNETKRYSQRPTNTFVVIGIYLYTLKLIFLGLTSLPVQIIR